MSSSKKNWKELYSLQDKALDALAGHFGKFHLTGGTALGRFYLGHRYSEDLDLFVNRDPDFKKYVATVRSALSRNFILSEDKIILYDDFVRLWIPGLEELKIEMVNDVEERWGEPVMAGNIPVDTVCNILANKITALLSRDEPKDVFDIVTISQNYSFHWPDVFVYALRKAIIAEQDVVMRLSTFPVELLEGKIWLRDPADPEVFREHLRRVADDFLLARENSLGKGKIRIEDAAPAFFHR